MRKHVAAFVEAALKALVTPRRVLSVLEVGSYAVGGESVRPVVMRVLPDAKYMGVDMREGPGVDVVCDFADLRQVHGLGQFDVVICVDTLEHCKDPGPVVGNMAEALTAGGLAIVAAPFTFQVHEHPHDYWRFTQEGLRRLLDGPLWGEVVTFQDPVDSLWPHTVCALARRLGARFTDGPERVGIEEQFALSGCSWRTNEENVIPRRDKPMAFAVFDNDAQAYAFQTTFHALMGGETLEERYERLCREPSDIHEHLPILRELAGQCRSVVEFGTRGAVSTTALLAGQPGGLVFYDVDPLAVGMAMATLGAIRGRTDLQGVRTDTLTPGLVDGLDPDLLFIDTLHTYSQLSAELETHGVHARRWIALHDTTTFGLTGEDGTTPGLLQAVTEFLDRHPEWSVQERHENNNGLTILARACESVD